MTIAYTSSVQAKIATLRSNRAANHGTQVYELIKVDWPAPTGTIWYSTTLPDIVATRGPVALGITPVVAKIIADDAAAPFQTLSTDALIGDDQIEFEVGDLDGTFAQHLIDYGEGVKVTVSYYFPSTGSSSNRFNLEIWYGHLTLEDESAIDRIKLKAVLGFRSSESLVPNRQHYQNCGAVFGGLLPTLAVIAEYSGCIYDKNAGGSNGNNNPATGLPWTFCQRRSSQDCVDHGLSPLIHLSHATAIGTVQNNQTHGGNLFSTSAGNETNLKEPVPVIMGTRRKYGMPVLAFRRDLDNNTPDHGWFKAIYEACEGPVASITGAQITVGGVTQNAVALHYNYRLGTLGQTAVSDLTTHGYSGTALIIYNFGYVNPANINPADASASAMITGLSDIRQYSDQTTYTTGSTDNRVWQIMRALCDKRWGFGLDYQRLGIGDSWIDAAAWSNTAVKFTDTFGSAWFHVRGKSDIELVGKKVQTQIEDMCMAGRLSRPFVFNSKIQINPLRKQTSDELANAPVFTDEGTSGRNIIWEDGKTTLTVSRLSSLNLVNRVECTFDDVANNYVQRPLQPIEDVDAQLAAGVIVGDHARKINSKQYNLAGVTIESQAIKLAWSLLDLGPFDEGGLQNNLALKFKTWFLDALDLYPTQVIQVTAARLTKYKQPGTSTAFTYFRIKKMRRLNTLQVELEVQAYNETYMSTFEVDQSIPPGGEVFCSLDTDCGDGYRCLNGVCVPINPPPICQIAPSASDISYENGVLTIVPPACD